MTTVFCLSLRFRWLTFHHRPRPFLRSPADCEALRSPLQSTKKDISDLVGTYSTLETRVERLLANYDAYVSWPGRAGCICWLATPLIIRAPRLSEHELMRRVSVKLTSTPRSTRCRNSS